MSNGPTYWQPDWEIRWIPYTSKICLGHPSMATYCYICEKETENEH